MLDSSDGLARSVHQLATASDCGVSLEAARLPIDDAVDAVTDDSAERRELGVFFGEDFELVVTIPEAAADEAIAAVPGQCTRIGTVTESGCTLDGDPLPDRGYTHGE
jgi:thiamine-monophosphate kinase